MATHSDHHTNDDDHGHGHGHHSSVLADRVPAFVGLIGGAVLIFAILFGVVQWTNSRFESHGEGATAEAAK